ncbi:MAG: glycosyltransferase family 4 protein [Flavobacterium sp.]|nr:glycosyltransferase family 4 protein [Flavobacterium sp.]
MHIAFLTPEYPHPSVSHSAGIGTSIKNLVDALLKNNVQVSVFIYGQGNDEVLLEDNLSIYIIKQKKFSFFTWYFYRKYIQNYIQKIIINKKIDLLEAPDWTGITAFMSFKIPLIIRFHGSDAYFCKLENRKQKLKNYWFEKLALSRANAFIAPTNYAGELTKKIFNLKNKLVKTIYNGIDANKFQNPSYLDFDQGLVVYIGTIIRKKGVLELPEIFRLVLQQKPKSKLLLIGGDSPDIFTKSDSTWQLFQDSTNIEVLNKIQYLGKLTYDEIQMHLGNANVCVFPTFAETLGMVTIEAMSMQKAVVTSDFGWTNELIADKESGFLVDPKNHQEFANKIISLLNDKQLTLQIGVNARKRVEQIFDINEIVNENISFYKLIINKK